MERRRSSVAGRFYPASEKECITEINAYSRLPEGMVDSRKPAGGVVPHAGWVFSGPTAGKVFAFIKQSFEPETFVLLGATHRFMGGAPVVMDKGVWETPLGDVEIDEEIAAIIIDKSGVSVDTGVSAHEGEHSIEVQVPFIKHLFPEAKIVPVLTPPDALPEEFGEALGRLLKEKSAVVIGSTDLTHYGPEYGFAPKGVGQLALEWVRDTNDRKIIDLILELKAGEVVDCARQFHNSCGAGAVAATTAAMKEMGKVDGMLLEYTTSHDVLPRGEPGMFVGYAGIVF